MKRKKKHEGEWDGMAEGTRNGVAWPEGARESAGDAAAPGASSGAAPERGAETDVEALRAAAEATENRCLRLQADFANYRNRMLREKEDVWRRAHAELIEELLPALDHLDIALDAAVEHGAGESFVEGFRLVRDQFATALGKFGLTGFGALGEPFDPNLHEAIAHTPSENVEENCVMGQTRKGYMLGDRLLRAAQVIVSRGLAKPDANAETAEGDA